ncbi:MAG: hypothetical protein Tsb002_06790 [Wenzhouxiangellaceae bacterium]
MKRISRIVISVVLVVLVFSLGRLGQKYWDSQPSGAIGPYLQRPASDSISVHWRTEESVSSALRYRPAGADDFAELQQPQKQTQHHYRLQELQAATEYEYQIRNASGDYAERYSFWTPPASTSSKPVRLWALGDPGVNSPLAERVRQSATQWLEQHRRPLQPLIDVWLTTGDNAYTSGRDREYVSAIFKPYAQWLAQYPLWPAYGNHDDRRWAFYPIFDLPTQGESGGVPSHSESFYAFDYGPVHFIMLDSQDHADDVGGEMMSWLQRDLTANQQPWTIVIFHHAPYSRGSHDSDDDIGSDWRMGAIREHYLPVLEGQGVDVVITGHSHVYERSHLLAGHYGKAYTFDAGFVRDDGDGFDRYSRPEQCDEACGTLYVVTGASAELKGGSLDHPALPVAMAKGGSVIMEIDGPCLRGGYLGDDGVWADRYTLAKDAVECSMLPE